MKLIRNELLYRDDHIAIEYNFIEDWIYVNWRGYQNYDTVVAGCEKMLELMKFHACYRILNDNTRVEGQWSAASKWGSDVWLPAMREAGLQWFAWVYSQSVLSRLSTDKMVKLAKNPDYVKVFDHTDLAEDWLRSKV
ncbi:hypothetical protein ABID22_003964 [Pontibacter aydingkolensis]|uniref:SpoIIAA-like n=1 Tax=Pontibacter aydingkolensis TaxID=1911536 RepID=A0ABS7CXF9_9BACT|nr:hypothetical protein [Pontibacter aydingkolensis]MBW7468558.1 hypothetical protein [Pontibacter aydingkolensis]